VTAKRPGVVSDQGHQCLEASGIDNLKSELHKSNVRALCDQPHDDSETSNAPDPVGTFGPTGATAAPTPWRYDTSNKEHTMPETTSETANTEQTENDAKTRHDAIQQLGRSLDEWRAKIDKLMVQLDLANLDLRDEIRKRLDTTQNVYLAARSRLSEARQDADSNLSSLRLGLEQLLRDLGEAYGAAEAVVRRAREE
jgi:hypothetical protein